MRWLYTLIGLTLACTGLHAADEPGTQDPSTEPPAASEASNPVGTDDESAPATTHPPADAGKDPKGIWEHPPVPLPADGVASIYVIPIHEQIGPTNAYILRRGLKEAIDNGVEVVVLDIDTPGGRLDVTLEMMEMLDRFEGRSIAYINDEAMSAGSLISALADEICFAPRGIIGAAAVISGTGEEVPATLKMKIDSYMDAKVRALTRADPRRADVLRAMMQEDYVLELDGETLKEEGKLLSLTADQAMRLYGEPPTPLFGAGIYDDVESLAREQYGVGNFEIKEFEVSWSEQVAMYMETISPFLLGIGFLLLLIEFKTPGFGVMGILGLCLLAVVFLGNYVAGLAGYEPLIVFVFGFLLVMVELIFVPGAMVLAIMGLLMMFGSLVWSLADVWPTEGGSIDIRWEGIVDAVGQVLLGCLVALLLLALLYRFLPKGFIWDKLVLQRAVAGGPGAAPIADRFAAGAALPSVGARGRAISNLRPSGSVEIEGRRYEATLGVGAAERGDEVVVVGRKDFYLVVEKQG